MSTRSYIGKELDNGDIEYIYCHFDGYVKGGVGEKLYNFYNTVEKLMTYYQWVI